MALFNLSHSKEQSFLSLCPTVLFPQNKGLVGQSLPPVLVRWVRSIFHWPWYRSKLADKDWSTQKLNCNMTKESCGGLVANLTTRWVQSYGEISTGRSPIGPSISHWPWYTSKLTRGQNRALRNWNAIWPRKDGRVVSLKVTTRLLSLGLYLKWE